MALKAGYYGVKKKILDELRKLDGILPSGVSPTNKLVTEDAIKDLWNANAITGVRNRFNYEAWKNTAVSAATASWANNGLVLTATAVNGRTNLSISDNAKIPVIEGEALIFKWTDTDSNNDAYFDVYDSRNTTNALAHEPINNGSVVITVPEGCTLLVYRVIVNTLDHVANIKDIICTSATDTSVIYEPYAMSNSELTDSAADQKTAINAIIAAATEAADFAAFKTAMGAITPVTRSLSIQEPETRTSDPEPEQETKTTKRSTKKTEVTE